MLNPSRKFIISTSTLSSFTIALLNLCILFANLRARRFFRSIFLSSLKDSSSSLEESYPLPPMAASNTSPFHKTLSTRMSPPFFKTLSLPTRASTYSMRRVLSASTNAMSNAACGELFDAISSTVASASLTRSNSQPAILLYVKDMESPPKSFTSILSERSLDASFAPSSPMPCSVIAFKCAAASPNALLSRSNDRTNGPPPSRVPTTGSAMPPPKHAPAAAAPSRKQAVAYPVNVPISSTRPPRDADVSVERRPPCIDPDTMWAPLGRKRAVFDSTSRKRGQRSVECAAL
mmetsp:Transcript_28798/g.69356  ORF Transcript_28798/g.69356 Transcript_28798/m.69356 type:complete len:291 (-) Transcript_28798:596-1468(-)